MENITTRDKIKSLIESDPVGHSQAKVAKEAGLNSGTLSRWLNDKYEGDNDAVDRKMEQYLRILNERTKYSDDLPFVETKNAVRVLDMCSYSMAVGAMCMVTSRAGYGKSRALQEFESQNENVILIYVSGVFTQRSILTQMARKLKLSTGSTDEMLGRMVDVLKDSSRLIIVDEAQKMYYRTMEIFREIHDMTGVGVLLSGSRFLYERITGKQKLDKDMGFDQMYSRIQRYHELPPNDAEDITLMLRSVFPDVSDSLGEYIFKQTLGSGRNLRNIIKMARAQNYTTMTKDVFDEVSQYVIMAA